MKTDKKMKNKEKRIGEIICKDDLDKSSHPYIYTLLQCDFASCPINKVFFSQSLIFHWPCDVFWPVECDRNGVQVLKPQVIL